MSEKYRDKVGEGAEARIADLAHRGGLVEAARLERRHQSRQLVEEDSFSPDDVPKSLAPPRQMLSHNFEEGFIRHPEMTVVDYDDDEADDDYDIVYRGAYSDSESDDDSDAGESLESEQTPVGEQQVGLLREHDDEILDEVSEAASIQKSQAERLTKGGFESFFMGSILGSDSGNPDAAESQLPSDELPMSDEDRSSLVVGEYSEVPHLLSELKTNFAVVQDDLVPILRKTRKRKFLSRPGLNLVQDKFRASQLASMNILFYLAMIARGEDPKNHPVVRSLVDSRARLQRVSEAEKRANPSIRRVRELFSSEEPVFRIQKVKKKKKRAVSVDDDVGVRKQQRRVRFALPGTETEATAVDSLLDEEREEEEEEEGPEPEPETEGEEGMSLADFSAFRDIMDELEDHIDVVSEDKQITGRKRPRPSAALDDNPRRRKRAKVAARLQEDREFLDGPQERPAPSSEIVKSKGLREKGRGFWHPRVKHRARYYFKTQKLREMNRRFEGEKGGNYGGEDSIRDRSVRSRKIRR